MNNSDIKALRTQELTDAQRCHGMREQRENEIVIFVDGVKDLTVSQTGDSVIVGGTINGKTLSRAFTVKNGMTVKSHSVTLGLLRIELA